MNTSTVDLAIVGLAGLLCGIIFGRAISGSGVMLSDASSATQLKRSDSIPGAFKLRDPPG